VVTPVAVHWLT